MPVGGPAWLTIADNATGVVEGVKRIEAHALVPNYIPVYGYIYGCRTGRLVEVPEATTAGKVS
jgi:carbonic anhydrase